MSQKSEHRHALLSQAARCRAYLPTLRELRDEAEKRFHELDRLLTDEREAVKDIMDEVDAMDGKQPAPSSEPVETSKPCEECGEPKDLSEFQRHPTSRDGRVKTCRDCLKARRETEATGAAVAS